MKVFVVNIETEEVDGPTRVRVNEEETVREFKTHLSKLFKMEVDTMKVSKCQQTNSNL